ncbi:MAG: exosortase/archaeosortase family protein [Candidatus Diapherotrites archaeon]
MVKFLLIFAVLETLLVFSDLSILNNSLAGFEAGLLGLRHSGNIIFAGGGELRISESCTGLASVVVLASIVFALRKPEPAKKIKIFLAGFAVLFPLNLLRLYLVVLAAVIWGAGAAEAVHVASWFAVAGIVLALWHFLTVKIAGTKELRELL